MMGYMYSQAERVIVWLGAGSERVEYAMEELCTNHLVSWGAALSAEAGLTELFELTYWSRAWIVQEYVLAKTIAIWCESLQIDGAWLDIGYGMLAFRAYRNLPATRVIAARKKRMSGRTIPSMKPANDTTMLELLALFCQNLHCEDPRDRIYSLLSLLETTENPWQLTSDYSKSTAVLFADVARSFHDPGTSIEAPESKAAIDSLVQMLKLSEEDERVKYSRGVLEASQGWLLYTGQLAESHFGDYFWQSEETKAVREARRKLEASRNWALYVGEDDD
jgi:hypothetical protein